MYAAILIFILFHTEIHQWNKLKTQPIFSFKNTKLEGIKKIDLFF